MCTLSSAHLRCWLRLASLLTEGFITHSHFRLVGLEWLLVILECHPSTSSIPRAVWVLSFTRTELYFWHTNCHGITDATSRRTGKKSHMLSSHHACTTVIPSTWATAKMSISHFQLIQNSAATLLTISERHNHVTLNLATLQWLPVSYRGYFNFYLFLQVLDYIYIMDLFRPY